MTTPFTIVWRGAPRMPHGQKTAKVNFYRDTRSRCGIIVTDMKGWRGYQIAFCGILYGVCCAVPAYANDSLPLVDISGETNRHVVIAAGTEKQYQGHPTTVMTADGWHAAVENVREAVRRAESALSGDLRVREFLSESCTTPSCYGKISQSIKHNIKGML